MSSLALTVLPDAEADMRDGFLWYFEKSPVAAEAFGSEVSDAIDRLEKTAVDWPKDEEGVHFYHLRNFPYTIWYEIAETR